MVDVEIGIGKSARRAYGLDDVAIVPSRRTRDPDCVELSWEIDAFSFGLPLLAAAMDSVMSPTAVIEVGRLGGLGVLNLEGVWTRFEDPEPFLQEVADLPTDKAVARLQELCREPVDPELVGQRIREIRDAGVVSCAAVTPQRTEALAPSILAAELDLLVIQGTVVSAEHVSKAGTPLNLKRFVRELPIPVIVGGCASYQTALHLMRTGAAGVLVGVDSGATLGIGVPTATAIADARGARMRHLDETGVYCHVIAGGGIASGGDVAKAIACGADAVVMGAALAGSGERTVEHAVQDVAAALRKSMATTGYETVKEFQKAELVMIGTGTSLP